MTTEDLERKTQQFQKADRDPDTQKRDRVQTRKYTKFAKAHCGLTEDDLELCWMLKHNRIHPDHLKDSDFANFLTHEFNYHKEKGNKLYSCLRPSKSYITSCIKRAGKNPINYPLFISC